MRWPPASAASTWNRGTSWTCCRIAAARDAVARASVRVNPDVDALTHAKISTGKAENKFGVGIDEAREWFADSARLTHVRLDGLHVHIGSQMLAWIRSGWRCNAWPLSGVNWPLPDMRSTVSMSVAASAYAIATARISLFP